MAAALSALGLFLAVLATVLLQRRVDRKDGL